MSAEFTQPSRSFCDDNQLSTQKFHKNIPSPRYLSDNAGQTFQLTKLMSTNRLSHRAAPRPSPINPWPSTWSCYFLRTPRHHTRSLKRTTRTKESSDRSCCFNIRNPDEDRASPQKYILNTNKTETCRRLNSRDTHRLSRLMMSLVQTRWLQMVKKVSKKFNRWNAWNGSNGWNGCNGSNGFKSFKWSDGLMVISSILKI